MNELLTPELQSNKVNKYRLITFFLDYIKSIDPFTRSSIAVFLLLILVTPFIISNVFDVRQRAATVGTIYYVSSIGNDSNSGTAQSAPWRTIGKLNTVVFMQGDQIVFEGGKTFDGMLYLDQMDLGSEQSPIIISSYGNGKAIIRNISGTALYGYNTAGIKINNISFVGPGRTVGDGDGINFYNDSGIVKDFLEISNVDVSGFKKSGIVIGGWNGQSGFKNIRITNSEIHDNGQDGIKIYGQKMYSNENVYVGYVKSYNNTGTSGLPENTGNGILISSVNGGIIEHSIAYENGALSTSPSGPGGIWTYDSNNVIIQFNESYKNHTGVDVDGLGFDLDINVTNSIMQYNYSHENDGSGYLLMGIVANNPAYSNSYDNIVRYNISENDGRKATSKPQGGIFIYGGAKGIDVYNNTIYMSPNGSNQSSAVLLGNWADTDKDPINVHFRNNIFYTVSTAPILNVNQEQLQSANDFIFQNNSYYNSSSLKFIWGGATYTSLDSWRSSTNQEKLSGNSTGFTVNPQLENPGYGGTIGTINNLSSLSAYKLRASSPLIDKGLSLTNLFGQQIGSRDFYGTSIPNGNTYDIGAHEYPQNSTPTSVQVTPTLPVAATPTAVPTISSADTINPQVSITYPVNGSKVDNRRVIIKVSATDNINVAKVDFYIDEKVVFSDLSAPYEYIWNTRKVSTGAHRIKAIASDPSNNTAYSEIIIYR